MFFNPIVTKVKSVPVIIYPCPGIEKFFNRKQKGCLEKYVEKVYQKNNLQKKGKYNIIILWNDGNDVIVDMWIYDKIDSWGSGPLVDVKIFRNGIPDNSSGVSAGNGLVLLGVEEQHRWDSNSLQDYLKGPRPKLPKKICVGKSFYQA